MQGQSRADRVFDVLARLVNACIGAGFAFWLGARVTRLLMRRLDVDWSSVLAISVAVGAVGGWIWGKKIWAAIDRSFRGGW